MVLPITHGMVMTAKMQRPLVIALPQSSWPLQFSVSLMDTPYIFICHEGHWHCLAIYTSHMILTVFPLTTLISDMQLGGGAHAGLEV